MNTMAIVFQLIARCYSARAECCETVKQALVEAGNRTLKSLHSYLSEARHSDPINHVYFLLLLQLVLLAEQPGWYVDWLLKE
jgi:hypothetical protein